MQEFNLAEILKDCPQGTKLYSPLFGEVTLDSVTYASNAYSIKIQCPTYGTTFITSNGRFHDRDLGECILFPSKDNRDWSTFKIKKPKFDVRTLRPFDRMLVKLSDEDTWKIDFFSHIDKKGDVKLALWSFGRFIPYNADTQDLVGTRDEAPEFYRTWE